MAIGKLSRALEEFETYSKVVSEDQVTRASETGLIIRNDANLSKGKIARKKSKKNPAVAKKSRKTRGCVQ